MKEKFQLGLVVFILICLTACAVSSSLDPNDPVIEHYKASVYQEK